MKNFFRKLLKIPLILRICIGLAAGVLLGLFLPDFTVIGILGTLFIGALKAIAPILVFILVISSLCYAGKGIGKRFTTVIILYMLSTLLAAFVAVAASFIFPIKVPLAEISEITNAPHDLGDVFSTLLTGMVQNPISTLTNANYLGILTWAIFAGLILRKIASETTKTLLKDFADCISKIVSCIIQCAPLGIMGIVFTTIKTNGIGIFNSYGKLILVLVACMVIQAIIVNPIIVGICIKKNPFPLVFKCLRRSAITAFFTRSSAANIPVNMELCEEMGLDKDYYSVSIPLGATINMDGAAITITVMSLAAAYSIGIEVNFPMALLLSIVATLGACGSSGVAGGSLLLIPMACSLLNVPADVSMQLVSIGFVIGVIQDSMETALNSSSDVLFTAAAEFREMKKSKSEK
ncbi:MAG: serine/threonine transporter SstT [Treponema sp.]|nr:serine/threonine transporter SstT [Treponema sp.]